MADLLKSKIVLVFAVFFVLAGSAFALTDAELIAIRDGFDGRRDSMLASQVAKPYPSGDPTVPEQWSLAVWGLQDYALAALYLNTELPQANQAVIDAVDLMLGDFELMDHSGHWKGNLFFRIYQFFAADSEYYPGRLTPAAEAKICEFFWEWGKSRSRVSDTNIEIYQTWSYWGSENHDGQRDTTAWSAASILKDVAPYNTYTFDDGYTAQQHYDAWTAYATEYLRERAKKGLCIELGTPTYTKYTLQGWYNYYDFAENQTLRKIAGMTLDLWWADWAESQLNSVWGGGKSRVYAKDSTKGSESTTGMCWYYLNIGTYRSKHPGIMCMATSTHRLPLVVMDMALDIDGRGTYVKRSRRQGLKKLPVPSGVPAETNVGDPDFGGIHRYTYVRPEFILGTGMIQKRSNDDWLPISSQNRWHGAIFANHKDSRVFPAVQGKEAYDYKTRNPHWSVQNKGTLITQKIAYKTNDDMRVYFASSHLTISESGGWVFASSGDAYVAARPAWGTYTWDDSNWIRFSDPFAPAIMEVAPATDHMEMFAMFQSSVLNQTIDVTNNILTYNGLGSSGTFTFDTQGSGTPTVNGVAVDYAPDYTFQSPFLNEDWASGVVTIKKDNRDLTLDFNNALSGGCGDWGYLAADFDRNCVVDIFDLRVLTLEWLDDRSNPVSGSDDYPNISESGWPLPGNYNIPKAQVTPVIDGTVSTGEWADARTVEMVYPSMMEPPNTGTIHTGSTAPASAADFSIYWYLKWDDSDLYVLGITFDEIYDSGDVSGICFNPMNNQSAGFPEDVFLWVLQSDCTIVPFYTAGPTDSVMTCSTGQGNYVYEIKIPWSDFFAGSAYTPAAGDIHGFGLLSQDYDSSGVMEHYLVDFGSGVSSVGNASTWNTITLVEQIPKGEAGTSDADISLDYKVNLEDYVSLADSWMQCTHPVEDGCVDVR